MSAKDMKMKADTVNRDNFLKTLESARIEMENAIAAAASKGRYEYIADYYDSDFGHEPENILTKVAEFFTKDGYFAKYYRNENEYAYSKRVHRIVIRWDT